METSLIAVCWVRHKLRPLSLREDVVKAPLPPGEGLGRGDQMKQLGVANAPFYANHLKILPTPNKETPNPCKFTKS